MWHVKTELQPLLHNSTNLGFLHLQHEYASHEELAPAIQALEKNQTAAGFKILKGFGNQ